VKGLKMIGGGLAALWALGCLLKIPSSIALLGRSDFAASRLIGSLVGVVVAGGVSFLCFRSALRRKAAGGNVGGA
jgi:hypothetical protein